MSGRATISAERTRTNTVSRRPVFRPAAAPSRTDRTARPVQTNVTRAESPARGPFPLRSVSEISAERQADTLKLRNAASKKPGQKAPQNPAEDPAFQAVSKNAGDKARALKKHDKTEKKLQEGKLGAEAPAGEKVAHAKGEVVKEMNQVKVKPKIFDRDQFLRKFDQQIKAALPKNKSEAEKFADAKEPNEPEGIKTLKGEVSDGVKDAKNDATQPLSEASQKAPDPGAIPTPDHQPLEKDKPGNVPAVANPQQAAPKRKTDDEVSMQAEASTLDTQMQEGEVTPAQLQKSNEPAFLAANERKNAAQEKARKAPEDYRKEETPTLDAQKTEAESGISGQMRGIHGLRANQFSGINKNKADVKSKNEQMREQIRKQLEGIYNETKTSVDRQLVNLETAVTTKFTNDLARATRNFKHNVDEKIKDLGIGDAISDFFTGDDSKQNIFDAEKAKFESELRVTINDIATTVEAGLTAAMRTIQEGKDKVAREVDKMSPGERKIAEGIKGEIDEKFRALETKVNEKQGALVESLAKKYVEGVTQLNEIFEKIKEENMGWIERAAAAVKGVIKAIKELKDMLFGVLAKAKSVIMSIIHDPIKFIGNLISAVKLGLSNFTRNIWVHLKQGFFAWLLGSLPPGIEIPKNWDLISIFKFVASILGLTWANIRDRAVKKIGEPVVKAMETTFDIFMVIVKEGLGGLWRLIKEKLNNLKEMVIDAVLNFLKERVIMAGIAWIIGLLNPAGAFIKACKAIYDIITFIIERGRQIMEFVNSVLDSIAEIVAGKLGPAAKRVEDSLAKAIPIAIGFLASLLGLGGLSEKVMEIIKKIQAPINKAIDWILDKAIAFAKKVGIDKLVGKVKSGIEKGKEKVKEKGKEIAGKVLNFFGVKSKFVDGKGASHSVYFKKSGNSAVVMVASDPTTVESFLVAYEKRLDGKLSKHKSDKIVEIRSVLGGPMADHLKSLGTETDETKKNDLQRLLLEENVKLSRLLQHLLAGDDAIGKLLEKYKLEGLTGTFGSMPKAAGDQLTADHQPQAAVFKVLAGVDIFKGRNMEKRASGHATDGFAINLYHKRHVAGRTYGGKSGGSMKQFSTKVAEATNGVETDQKKRDAIVDIAVKFALDEDVKAVENLLNVEANFDDINSLPDMENEKKKELKTSVRQNIIKGENQIKNQNLADLKK